MTHHMNAALQKTQPEIYPGFHESHCTKRGESSFRGERAAVMRLSFCQLIIRRRGKVHFSLFLLNRWIVGLGLHAVRNKSRLRFESVCMSSADQSAHMQINWGEVRHSGINIQDRQVACHQVAMHIKPTHQNSRILIGKSGKTAALLLLNVTAHLHPKCHSSSV